VMTNANMKFNLLIFVVNTYFLFLFFSMR